MKPLGSFEISSQFEDIMQTPSSWRGGESHQHAQCKRCFFYRCNDSNIEACARERLLLILLFHFFRLFSRGSESFLIGVVLVLDEILHFLTRF